MRLQNRVNFLRTKLASVVESIEGIGEGVVTDGTFEPLLAFGSAPMFMSFEMTAE
jgi:hypothetical protein